jgi:hypothetical protein
LSERTFKLAGWTPQGRPPEGRELDASRQLIREAIFSIYYRKKAIYAKRQMPPQPVHLSEIYLEVCSRVSIARHCGGWPFLHHEKRWWDRRVNECACSAYYVDGVAKVVSSSAGFYEPNPVLFIKKGAEPVEA